MKKTLFCVLTIVGVLYTSCEKEKKSINEEKKQTETVFDTSSIENFVNSLPDPEQEIAVPEDVAIDSIITRDERQECKTISYHTTSSFSEQFLLNPTNDIIFEGNIIDGNSVLDGSYQPLILPRRPLRISTSLSNKEGNSSILVENVSLSGLREARKKLINDCEMNGATEAQSQIEIIEVSSEEDLNLKLGVSADFGKKASIASNFTFDKSQYDKSFLVRFQQIFYTVDIDLPSSPADFFDPSVTAEDIQRVLPSKTAPCYISSIKYGRMAYFSVEVKGKSIEQTASLEAQVKALIQANSANQQTFTNNFKDSRISGTIIGGNAGDAVKVSSIEEMMNFINDNGNFSKENPGCQISYTLRSLRNNKVFNVVNSNNYDIRVCNTYEGNISLHGISSITTNCEVYGVGFININDTEEWKDEGKMNAFGITRNNAIALNTNGNFLFDNNATLKPDLSRFKINYADMKDKYIVFRFYLKERDGNDTTKKACKIDGMDDSFEIKDFAFSIKDLYEKNVKELEITLRSPYNTICNHTTSGGSYSKKKKSATEIDEITLIYKLYNQ